MRHFVKYYLPAIFWALLILLVSSIPSQYLIKTGLFKIDKSIHLFTFFILGWLGRRAVIHQDRYPRLREHSLLASFVFVLAYGTFNELYQTIIPGRQPDLLDLFADALGGLLFVLMVWIGRWRRTGRRGPPYLRNSTDAR